MAILAKLQPSYAIIPVRSPVAAKKAFNTLVRRLAAGCGDGDILSLNQ
jgi:hypothetical protein